jgi:glutathione S-transferase
MKLTLHSAWRSSAAYRVRIGLNLKGLAYDTAPVNLVASQHQEPAFAPSTPSSWCRRWRSTGAA